MSVVISGYEAAPAADVASLPDLAAYPLRVLCRAREPLALPVFSGSAVRGALIGGVREVACANPAAPSCTACALHPVCGASRLVATVDPDGGRGADVPRPIVVRPPLDGARTLAAGESFSFWVTLVGEREVQLFPYLALGLRRMAELGVGRTGQRGRFTVEQVTAINPFTGAAKAVMQDGDALVSLPDAPVTSEQVAGWSRSQGDVRRVTLRLRTPLRLVVEGKLVQRLTFEALLRRVMRRVTDLARAFGGGAPALAWSGLLARAAAVQVVDDRTRWVDVDSRSSRQGRTVPIGGLVGAVTFEGAIAPFLPWLTWAELVGAGKDVTKGNGVIEVAIPQPAA